MMKSPKRTKETILVVNIGNTSTSYGLYAGGKLTRVGRLPTGIDKRREISARIPRLIKNGRVTGAAISSVVPRINVLWESVLEQCGGNCPVLWVHHRLNLGIPVTYPRPETIGADRLVNAVMAAHHYGTPVIVADFGTAATFDVVTRKQGFIGGVIAPGLPLMFDYLSDKTALLPKIDPRRVRHGIGKSTRDAIQLGAWWGYGGLAKSILSKLKTLIKERNVRICATGGHARWVLKSAGLSLPVDPLLTLKGLGRIYELNAKK